MVLCIPTILASVLFVFGSGVRAGNIVRGLAAVLACGAAYVAVFALLSLCTRRPVLLGFLYVVLWEGSIANFAPSADRLSIAAYGRAIIAGGLIGAQRFNVPTTGTVTALIVLAAVTVVAALYGGHRLSRVELP
jgi:ABC-2 type transport system permease protein